MLGDKVIGWMEGGAEYQVQHTEQIMRNRSHKPKSI